MPLFRTFSRAAFAAALAYAPWAYGGTTSQSIQIIEWLLSVTLVLWFVDLALNRRVPRLPRTLVVAIAALLVIGAWMTFNAKAICDYEFATFAPIAAPFPWLPGSVDYALSAAWMVRMALLCGAVLFVVDLVQDNEALLWLWWTIAIVGGSVALLGLLQKATGAQAIFWQPAPPWAQQTFFGPYYYHANAGSYLNLVLPMAAGLATRSFLTSGKPLSRALWLLIFVLTLVAVVANTSRMAQTIAVLLVAALAWRLGRRIVPQLSHTEKSVAIGGAAAVVVALLGVAQASHLEQPLQRWQQLYIWRDARWIATSIAARSLPEAGVLGFGPGTFRAVFPWLNDAAPLQAPGFWRFLHEDYLQVALEWGALGSALWAVLFFGGIIGAMRSYRAGARTAWSPRQRMLIELAIISLGGVALHALVDFPLQIASIQLYAATFLGICWSSSQWRANRTQAASAPLPSA